MGSNTRAVSVPLWPSPEGKEARKEISDIINGK